MEDQLRREFLAEAEDLIEALISDTKNLRARRAEGRIRRELIGRIFRHVHTLKGSGAAVELDQTAEIAHEFESLLEEMRLGHVSVSDDVLDAFDAATNAILQSLSAVARGETQQLPRFLIERLRQLARKDEAGTDAASPARFQLLLDALPADIRQSLSEQESHRLREAAAEGARLFLISVNFDLPTFDERFRDLSSALTETGEIISTMPGLEASAPDQINFRILYAAEIDNEEIAARLASFSNLALTQLNAADQARDVANEAAGEALMEEERAAPVASLAPLSTLVRVELEELDEIVSNAHELFTDITGALDLALQQNLPRAARSELEIRSARVRRRFFELEERLIELRMVSIAQTLQRAARSGAISAREVGKEVDFETLGGDVRLDKSLADAISDPLLHLLRNAVDHGIEAKDDRALSGKSARGRVLIEAIAEGSRVRVRITDDGRGIDTQRVARAAIERGIIDAQATITRQQSLRLIFRPGFSTASAVSNVSGRGVGLDVVESAVEKIGGELRVASEVGEGTTFEMLLPTTLALVASLIVRSAGHAYCVDASHIAEAGFVATNEIERLGETAMIHWRGQMMPLIEMRKLLAQKAAPHAPEKEPERIAVIVAYVARQRDEEEAAGQALQQAAVAVDAWDGHKEVLVRGLGRHAARWRGISGATELNDGTIALMLDLPRLLEMAL